VNKFTQHAYFHDSPSGKPERVSKVCESMSVQALLLLLTVLLSTTGTAISQTEQSGSIRALIQQSLSDMPARDSFGFQQPDDAALQDFSTLFELAATGQHNEIATLAQTWGYEFIRFIHQENTPDTLYILRERTPILRGWGTYIWRATGYDRDVQVQVPHPLFDFNTPAVGLRTFMDFRMRFFAMAGSHRYANGDDSQVSDMARNHNSIFQRAHQAWSPSPAVQFHGFNDASSTYEGYPQNIITNGTTTPPPVHYTVRDLLRARSYTADVYDEQTRNDVRLLAATRNPQGQWSAGNEHVFLHIEMARELRTVATQIGTVISAFAEAFPAERGPMEAGLYEVGTGEATAYIGLGEAFADLISRRTVGDVILQIQNDLTEGHNLFLGIDPHPYSIRIEPAPNRNPVVRFTSPQTNTAINGALIIGSTADDVHSLAVTGNIIIDGNNGSEDRALTFEIPSGAGSSNYFRLHGDVRDVTIRSMVFRSMNNAFDTWLISPVTSFDTPLFGRRITFENNHILANPDRSSGRALNVWGQGGTDTGVRQLTLRNNLLEARRYGVWFRAAGGSATIQDNTIRITETLNTNAYGILIDAVADPTDEIVIQGNDFSGTSAGSLTGVALRSGASYSLSGNEFRNLTATGLLTGVQIAAPGDFALNANAFFDFRGDGGVEMISVESGISGDVNLSLFNNRLSGFASGAETGQSLTGIVIRSALSPHRVQATLYHNTVRMTPLQVSGSGWEYRGLSLFSNARISAVLRNNILLNDDTNDGTVTSFAYYQGASAASGFDSDNNVLAGAGLRADASTWLSRHGAESTATVLLSAHQSATGGDAASVQVEPELDDELRLTGASLHDPALRGVPLTSVTTDAFGNTRSNASPSMGAYEAPLHTSTVLEETQPAETQLYPNWPNPFNPSTKIRYSLDSGGLVTLRVYDVTGRLVAVLEDAVKPAGTHTVTFTAAGLSSGVYFYRLETPVWQQTRSMVLIR